MQNRRASVKSCRKGDILAEDVRNDSGVILVAKNTIINQYIIDKLVPLYPDDVWLYEPLEQSDVQKSARKLRKISLNYNKAISWMRNILHKLSVENKIEYEEIEAVSDIIFKNITEKSHIVKYLSKIKSEDEYTYTHCVNVAFYAMLMAKWLDFSHEKIKEVIQAALLHDIGKIKLSNDLLNKKGKLSSQEYDQVKKHTVYGFEMLKGEEKLSTAVKKAVLSHHERIDGAGYPEGLLGNDIEYYAKIIAIADVYDAMTQNRVYKNKVSPFDAFDMFLTVGLSQFDTIILHTFLKNLSVFYIGVNVLLSDGNKGKIVYVPPHNIVCPVVNVGLEYIDLSREKNLKVVAVI